MLYKAQLPPCSGEFLWNRSSRRCPSPSRLRIELNSVKKRQFEGNSKPRVSQMRNLTFAINFTLDGCCDHTKTMADEELLDYYAQLVRDFDLFVYGRKTY